jgi:poly(A) polymerase
MMPIESLFVDSTRRILAALRAYGGEARFVGGCVRDALLDRKPHDIDFAANLPPEQITAACAQHGIELMQRAWGLPFGTVIARVDGELFEITSLRRDVSCDGRRAVVAYTQDWQEDAGRRDFTFNALYVDESGTLYDFFNGVQDLRDGVVRFIGDPDQRILEDHLRILRVFRFYARFGRVPMLEEVASACAHNAALLDKLSGERIADEMRNIFAIYERLPAILRLMGDLGVLRYVFPQMIHYEERVSALERLLQLGCHNYEYMLALFVRGSDPAALAKRWRLSNKMTAFLLKGCAVEPNEELLQMPRKSLATLGRELYEFALLLSAVNGVTVPEALLDYARNAEVPVFPVTSADLMERGITGKAIGEATKKLRDIWLESDCGVSKEELLRSC